MGTGVFRAPPPPVVHALRFCLTSRRGLASHLFVDFPSKLGQVSRTRQHFQRWKKAHGCAEVQILRISASRGDKFISYQVHYYTQAHELHESPRKVLATDANILWCEGRPGVLRITCVERAERYCTAQQMSRGMAYPPDCGHWMQK